MRWWTQWPLNLALFFLSFFFLFLSFHILFLLCGHGVHALWVSENTPLGARISSQLSSQVIFKYIFPQLKLPNLEFLAAKAALYVFMTVSRSVCQSVCLLVGRLVCPSVGLSVGLSVGRSVGLSIGRSVGWSVCRSGCLSIDQQLVPKSILSYQILKHHRKALGSILRSIEGQQMVVLAGIAALYVIMSISQKLGNEF